MEKSYYDKNRKARLEYQARYYQRKKWERSQYNKQYYQNHKHQHIHVKRDPNLNKIYQDLFTVTEKDANITLFDSNFI